MPAFLASQSQNVSVYLAYLKPTSQNIAYNGMEIEPLYAQKPNALQMYGT